MTGHYCKKSNFLNDYVVKCPFETFITIRSTLLYLISEKVVNSVIKTVMLHAWFYLYINGLHSVFLFITATTVIVILSTVITKPKDFPNLLTAFLYRKSNRFFCIWYN